MPYVTVVDAGGSVRWRSQEIDDPMVEVIENVLRVTDLQTGTVVATQKLMPGEKAIAPDEDAE